MKMKARPLLQNAKSPMESSFEGKESMFKELHLLKAEAPIIVTLSILTFINLLQS